ncbi:unnamed protein product [Ectocarpus sp. CCAP 1310/34]|nr:unnamed protein product [Ectocarpus sp. CCAP 1310/34]
MKLGLVACIVLSAAAGCNAFTGGPVTGAASLRQKKVDAVSKVAAASPRAGLDGTRRDVIQTASAAVAGLLSSAVLPAGALAAAKAEPNRRVFTTDGGVKFIVLKEGTGPVARDGDFCVVEFTGFLPDGAVFDASNAPGRKPIAFQLGKRQVIKGWEEVLRLMNAGAEVQMVVPADMAFGDKGICIDNGDCLVKPGMDVRYDLQLKRVAPTP